MVIKATGRTQMEAVPSLGSARAFSEELSAVAKISPATKGIRHDWTHRRKLCITLIIINLLIVLIGISYYAYLEHAKLQATTVQEANYIHTALNSINAKLLATNVKFATSENALAGETQQLSTYGFSGPVSQFASYDDLTAWLQTDNTHEQVYSSTFTCVEFASMMSEHAIRDGYWIFPAVDMADGHMKCITQIGNDLYSIEPQTNAVTLWAMTSG
jgi:hypothetical protein